MGRKHLSLQGSFTLQGCPGPCSKRIYVTHEDTASVVGVGADLAFINLLYVEGVAKPSY